MTTPDSGKIERINLGQRHELRSEIINTFKGTRYFFGVPDETIEEVLKKSHLLKIAPDYKLISEGSEKIEAFYFLLSGSVGVQFEGKYLYSINNTGDAVGEMAVITQSPRSADVITEMETQVIEILWQDILDFQDRDPIRTSAIFRMMTIFLAEKLNFTTQRVHLYENFVVEVMEREQKKDQQTEELTLKFDELEKSNEILKNLATRDPMTNLYNHGEFLIHLKRQITLYRRQQDPFTLMFGDLDNFKQVNDTYGHVVGDDVIRRTADILVDSLREEVDTIYRYGGEEFAVIMRNTPEPIGYMVIDRIRVKMEGKSVKANGNEICTTMSIGVGTYNPEWGVEDFIAKVDQAMYVAKRSGKNKVVPLAEVLAPDGPVTES